MPSLELTHWLMVAGTLLVVAALLVSESEGRRRTKLIHLPTSRPKSSQADAAFAKPSRLQAKEQRLVTNRDSQPPQSTGSSSKTLMYDGPLDIRWALPLRGARNGLFRLGAILGRIVRIQRTFGELQSAALL